MAASPTGRTPKILWTEAWQDRAEQMKADYEANTTSPATLGGRMYKLIKTVADAGTSGFEHGPFATWMFQATGDTAYATKAWTAMNRANTNAGLTSSGSGSIFNRTGAGLGGNWARQFGMEHALMYDWLYPALSAGDRSSLLAKLTECIGILTTDVNQFYKTNCNVTVGHWLAGAAIYYAAADDDATIATHWANSVWGGLTATGSNYDNRRNCIEYWLDQMTGGEGVEGSEYNIISTTLLSQFENYLAPTAGSGSFPKATALVPKFSQRMMFYTTPDFLQAFQWSDEQEERERLGGHLYNWYMACMAFIGGQSDSATRQQAMRHLLDLFAARGEPSTASGFLPWSRAFYTFDPYADAAADLSEVGKTFYASGRGTAIWKNSETDADAPHYWFQFYPEARVIDHKPFYWGNYQLYRRGEFAITHPLAYSAAGITGEGGSYLSDMTNCTTVEGMHSFPWGFDNKHPFQFRRVQAQAFGSDYLYVCGTQGGMVHPATGIDGLANYFDPPPAFCGEHTRSLVGLLTADDSADTIIVVERISADDPESLAKFTRYRTAGPPEQTLIPAHPRWASHIHPRTEPTVTGNAVTWTTDGGQLCRMDWLYPASGVTHTKQDETALSPYDCAAAEKKWRVRSTPDTPAQWSFNLYVISARDAGETHSATLVDGTADAVGVLITRSGNDDRLHVFNGEDSGGGLIGTFPSQAQATAALDGVHRRVNAFTIEWTQTTAAAKVRIHDLDPDESWSYSLDGGMSTALTITNGVAEIDVSDAMAHELFVTTGVAEPPPDPPPAERQRWHRSLPIPYLGASATVFGPAYWRYRRMLEKARRDR